MAALAAVLIGVISGVVVPPTVARADYATGGSGIYRDQIQWFSWGTASQPIPNTGLTKTNSFVIGGETLNVTCVLSNITANGGTGQALEAYRPGSWSGDGLDDLYNVGGTGGNNQLVVGLSNRTAGALVQAHFACSATLNGADFPLDGLVMADAEQSGSGEYIGATIANSANWRIIERYRSAGCTQSSQATRTAGNNLQLGMAANATCGSGPMAVAFMDGTTSADVQIKGGGKSAIALGVMLAFDRSDSPASYGEAVHGLQPAWNGGTVPIGGTAVNDSSFTLATQAQPTLRLGSTVTSDAAPIASPTAGTDSGDDGINPPVIQAVPGQPYTLPAVSCTGTGTVAGWIDFDGDGSYGDDEKSAAVPCTNGSATLTWTAVPADVKAALGSDHTFMRLRIGPTAASVSTPTGFASSGEVEDYRINVAAPTLNLIKLLPDRADPADQFQVSILDAGSAPVASATTSGSSARAATGARTVVPGTYLLRDDKVAGPTGAADYAPSIACVNTADGSDVAVTSDSGDQWQVRVPDAGFQIDCTITNTLRDAGISLAKSAGTPTGNRAGDTVPYSFTITNTGDQQLSDVTLSDPKIGDLRCPATTLAAGAEMTCTGSYTLTQADVDAGSVDNTAAVEAGTPGGRTVSDRDSATVSIDQQPRLTLDKTATVSPVDHADAVRVGDRIRYHFTVTNSGNVTVHGIGIDDDHVPGTITCADTTLAPGDSTTCVADDPYRVTQADVDAGGSVVNTATATGNDPRDAAVRSAEDTASVPVVAADPRLELLKSATRDGLSPDDPIAVGQEIHFTFAVQNTGNVTIDTLAIDDAVLTGPISCPQTRLAPGDVTVCSADQTHTVTQEDVDAGRFSNTATATGDDPSGDPVTSNESSTITPSDPDPSLHLEKFAGAPRDENGNTLVDSGDTLGYSFRIQNTGNVTLHDVTVNDPLAGPVSCAPTTLDPGAFATCSADSRYVITQADVDAGQVRNTATATAADPDDGPVASNAASTVTPADQTSGLRLVKHAQTPVDTNGNGLVDAGDTIAYTFTVTNTGTTTIADLAVADAKAGAVSCPVTSLPAGARTECSADAAYVISQAEADAGHVDNTATASGTGPGDDGVRSDPDSTRTPTDRVSTLTLDKQAGTPVDVNGNGLVDAGDTIAYSFTVTNTGTTTITGLAVHDPKIGTVTCEDTSLTPGQVQTCHGSYTITQADVDHGSVDNTASATGNDPDGDPVDPPTDRTSTPTDSRAALTLIKSAGAPDDVNGNGLVDVGDTIAYTFTVTNTGTTTVTDIAVHDPKAGSVTCDITTLAPGERARCTADLAYVISQAEVDAGRVDNHATATGSDPDGDPVDPAEDGTSTPTDSVPGLAMIKTAGPVRDDNDNGRTDAGDSIGYTFTVTNTGTVTITDVAVTDPKIGAVTCAPTELTPGAVADCRAVDRYAISQADVDSGAVDNTATATGQDPDHDQVSAEDSTHTPTDQIGALRLVKHAAAPVDVDDDQLIDAGDTIAYSFTVTNTGTLTITDLAVHDPKVGAVTCDVTELAPGESTACAATTPYPITQADVDAGQVRNTATADGHRPDGATVTSNEDGTVTPADRVSTLTVDKQAGEPVDVDGDGLADAGDTIGYTFLVTNTGTTTVDRIGIDDPKIDSIACEDTSLAPGGQTTCRAEYTITQNEVDAGSVRNTATAIGEDPDGDPVRSPEDGTSTPTDSRPRLQMIKKAGIPVDVNANGRVDAGDTIGYTFTVLNTGTVTITDVAVDDQKAGPVTCDVTVLAPGEFAACTADDPYVISQADVDSGSVINTATATGTDPAGDPVTSPPDGTSTPTADDAALTLEKHAGEPQDANHDTVIGDAGDTIAYTFTVTNTGAVTVHRIDVVDPKVGTVTCDDTSLAPGQVTTCRSDSPYLITQAEVDAGHVTNTAHAVGQDPDGRPVTSDDDSTRTPLPGTGALDLVKSAELSRDTDHSGSITPGDELSYRFEVTNTGTVTVHGIRIRDDLLAGAGAVIDCPATDLAPGAVAVCTGGPYPVTDDDAAAGSITNTATASADTPGGAAVAGAEDSVTSRVEAAEPPAADGPHGPPKPGGEGPHDAGPGGLAATGAGFGVGLPIAALALLATGVAVLIRSRRA